MITCFLRSELIHGQMWAAAKHNEWWIHEPILFYFLSMHCFVIFLYCTLSFGVVNTFVPLSKIIWRRVSFIANKSSPLFLWMYGHRSIHVIFDDHLLLYSSGLHVCINQLTWSSITNFILNTNLYPSSLMSYICTRNSHFNSNKNIGFVKFVTFFL